MPFGRGVNRTSCPKDRLQGSTRPKFFGSAIRRDMSGDGRVEAWSRLSAPSCAKGSGLKESAMSDETSPSPAPSGIRAPLDAAAPFPPPLRGSGGVGSDGYGSGGYGSGGFGVERARFGRFGVEGAAAAFACVFFLGILGSILFAPSLYSRTLLHDYWIPLDAGWRLRFGQIPHLDFHSPLGLSFAALSWLGVELGGTPAKSLVWMDLASAALTFAPAFLVSFSALSKRAAALSSIALVLLCLSPVQMDDYYFKVDWMGQYN